MIVELYVGISKG